MGWLVKIWGIFAAFTFKDKSPNLIICCTEKLLNEMKRILILLVLLVVGTQAYAVSSIVYSHTDIAKPFDLSDSSAEGRSQGYRIDFGLSAIEEEGFQFSAGLGEYKSQERYNESIEAKAFHFPIYYKFSFPTGAVVLVGLENSYWYDVKIQPTESVETNYDATQLFNGYSVQIFSPENFVLQFSVNSLRYEENRTMTALTMGLGYYFR